MQRLEVGGALRPIYVLLGVKRLMWKNMVETDRPRMAIWRMRIACWVPKATNTRVILTAFSLQWLHERVLMLCYTYIACRVVCVCLVPGADCYFFQVHNVCAIPELWSN